MYVKFFKRFFDFVIALVAMPFVLVLTLIVGIAIKLDDRGHAFLQCIKTQWITIFLGVNLR